MAAQEFQPQLSMQYAPYPPQPPSQYPPQNQGPKVPAHIQEENRRKYYEMLKAIDPDESTPIEFRHLIVGAAMRDRETGDAIRRLYDERHENPILKTSHPNSQGQPSARTGSVSNPPRQPSPPRPPPPPPPIHITPAIPQLMTLQYGSQMIQYQAMPLPQMQAPGNPYGQPPHYPQQPQFPPAPNQAQFQNPNQMQQYGSQPQMGGAPMTQAGSSTAQLNNGQPAEETPVDPDADPSEPKENPCNFTWVVDRTETHLGWTGNWDKCSAQRQLSIGYDVALKLQKLLKKLSVNMDKYFTFINRVHILTVMREVMIACLDTDTRVGKEVKECARLYDDMFVEAVGKLTDNQKRRLKKLEGGKWLEESKKTVEEAKRQDNVFRRLEEHVRLIESVED
ncbi:hypothetical protein F4778DRAFT_740035 [Xylariomycetidae sp. FL2044]|nr:hypothetical protein F4778DRAFT_740035 [Xylariomycetidae sp. FL2044]